MGWDQMRDSYDRVAGTYESRFIDELTDKPRDRQLLDAFATSVVGPVVDVGSGPGHIGAYVRSRGRWTVGADTSSEMATRSAGRLDAAVVADMRALPLADGSVAGIVAFYSLIHVRRPEVGRVLSEFERALRRGGRVLFCAHEGDGEVALAEFLGEPTPFVATLFGLDELVAATRATGMDVLFAERRPPYADEHPTTRLYIEAKRIRGA